MMRLKSRLVIALMVAVSVGIVIGVFTVMRVDNNPIASAQTGETTEDIGQRFPSSKVQLEVSSFAPAISSQAAISTARDLLRTHFNIDDSDLPAVATVAVFTGETHDSRRHASDVEVWVVVVEQVPFKITGGPAVTEGSTRRIRKGPTQYNVVIDAHTGEVVHSVMSGKVISAK